jgi:hypothetical protein
MTCIINPVCFELSSLEDDESSGYFIVTFISSWYIDVKRNKSMCLIDQYKILTIESRQVNIELDSYC